MIVKCPNCGKAVVINHLGRRRLELPVRNVCDTLRLHHSVLAAANELGCSRAYIYKVLKGERLTVQDVIKGDNRQ